MKESREAEAELLPGFCAASVYLCTIYARDCHFHLLQLRHERKGGKKYNKTLPPKSVATGITGLRANNDFFLCFLNKYCCTMSYWAGQVQNNRLFFWSPQPVRATANSIRYSIFFCYLKMCLWIPVGQRKRGRILF